jgi:hypothetical protein
MSYATIASITESSSLFKRIQACAAEQQKPKPYQEWVWDRLWDIAASPGWAAAWESAVAADIEDPGADEGVITDGMILAVVQPMV